MPSGAVLPRLSIDADTPTNLASLSASDFVTPASSPTMPSPLAPAAPPLSSPLSDGRRRLDAFNIKCLIGKGGFGKVFMVTHKATSQVYAMKVMDKEALIHRKAVADAHAERNILAMVGGLQKQQQQSEPDACVDNEAPFIVRLHVAFQTARRVYLVMDFASGGELMFHLRREAMLSEDDARFYAAELLLALETLHGMGIIHRDIKPENVLLDGAGHLVLTDFGLAKELDDAAGEQAHSWCGSEDYMAPEIVARKSHSGKPADYWAYGVFIYDCLCGQPPFSPLHEKGKLSRKRLHERILKAKFKLPAFLSRQCHSLLRSLLTKDPAKRLADPEAIRKHPWFSGLDWQKLRKKQIPPPILPAISSPTACFSPSLTKMEWSAPHSPLNLGAPAPTSATAGLGASGSASLPINVPNGAANGATDDGKLWEGFSFVAPGMEQHFELTAAAITAATTTLTANTNELHHHSHHNDPAGSGPLPHFVAATASAAIIGAGANTSAAPLATVSLALPSPSAPPPLRPLSGFGIEEGVSWVEGSLAAEIGSMANGTMPSPCESEVWHDALAAEVAEFSVEAKEAVEIERENIQ